VLGKSIFIYIAWAECASVRAYEAFQTVRVSCVLGKPCSTMSPLSSPPTPSSASRLHNGRSERVCEAGCIVKRDDLMYGSLLKSSQDFIIRLLSFFPIGSVMPQSASLGCHRPMIKPGYPTQTYTCDTHMLSCNTKH